MPHVKVTLVRAYNLLPKDIGGTSDPICVITVNGTQKFKNDPIMVNLNPVWENLKNNNTTIEFSDVDRDVVILQVLDYNVFTKNRPIGSVQLPLHVLELKNPREFTFPLLTNKQEPAGTIVVILEALDFGRPYGSSSSYTTRTFIDPAPKDGSLKVTVLNGSFTTAEPFLVSVTIDGISCKTGNERGPQPQFNRVFDFNYVRKVAKASVTFDIMRYGVFQNTIIGSATIALNTLKIGVGNTMTLTIGNLGHIVVDLKPNNFGFCETTAPLISQPVGQPNQPTSQVVVNQPVTQPVVNQPIQPTQPVVQPISQPTVMTHPTMQNPGPYPISNQPSTNSMLQSSVNSQNPGPYPISNQPISQYPTYPQQPGQSPHTPINYQSTGSFVSTTTSPMMRASSMYYPSGQPSSMINPPMNNEVSPTQQPHVPGSPLDMSNKSKSMVVRPLPTPQPVQQNVISPQTTPTTPKPLVQQNVPSAPRIIFPHAIDQDIPSTQSFAPTIDISQVEWRGLAFPEVPIPAARSLQ